jgi:MFS family permease
MAQADAAAAGAPQGVRPSRSSVIRTRIPARLDRLPWARFHWLVVAGLGTVWILDGLEVTNVGAVASRLTEKGSGISISASGIGLAAAIYVIGACLGALFFGQLTDRFGRKRLFMITLGVYIVATVATAFSFAPWYFYLCRFFTGAGIGGEYSSINSAIDELIPARVRGRVDLMINGSYWVGSLVGSLAALLFLDESFFAKDFGWRLSFGVGAVLGLSVLLVRRNVPESPRWLFIHGREQEAEEIVEQIERSVREQTDGSLPEPRGEIAVRQRERIPFREIARVAFERYPKRAVLGLALFVGQAFLYNGVTFNIGTLFTKFEHISSSAVPVITIVYAAGNFAGPLLLGRLFDTVGRKPMVSATYIGSAVVAAAMAVLFADHSLGEWGLEGMIVATFFLASAGASAAYLTVSEIFPMETRALAIAFFYAVGTGLGGIIGPLLFGRLISSGSFGEVAIAFWIGAAVMAIGGVAELFLGVRAEGVALEDVAEPITAAEVRDEPAPGAGEPADLEPAPGDLEPAPADLEPAPGDPERRAALSFRERAEEARAWAAEHRARAHELRAVGGERTGDREQARDREQAGDRERADGRQRVEQVLAEIDELRARALDERAAAHEERASAARSQAEAERAAADARAQAAEQRARAHEEQAAALAAENDLDAERHRALSQAAQERARAREQRARAEESRAQAERAQAERAQAEHEQAEDERDSAREPVLARAEMHDAWALMHEARALAAEHRAAGEPERAAEAERQAAAREELALAAQERVQAAEHRTQAEEVQGAERQVEEQARSRAEAAARERDRREVEERIRQRLERRQLRERAGLRRFRPGPGSAFYSPGMVGTAGTRRQEQAEEALEHEIEAIVRALDEHGVTEREQLARLVGARYWGPGRFGAALREALAEGRVRRLSRGTYGPPAGEEARR